MTILKMRPSQNARISIVHLGLAWQREIDKIIMTVGYHINAMEFLSEQAPRCLFPNVLYEEIVSIPNTQSGKAGG